MGLCEEVRNGCAEIAASSRFVKVDLTKLGVIAPGPPAAPDRERHYLEGSREDVATYLLSLNSINFGSGWFPTIRKRPGSSGYYTIAWALADHFRSRGPWSGAALRELDASTVARVLGQDPGHDLMELYAQALGDLGRFLGDRTALEIVENAGGSAEALAESLAGGMPFYDDRGFYKRAQIMSNDLQLAGICTFDDIDNLTIFADNLVPHVLRMDGVLRYEPELAERIDKEELLPPGEEEREIRACAVHACELIAQELRVPPRILDVWIWNRGQEPKYKAVPRHRTRTVYY
jgi:hypothetical protein